MHGPAYKPSNLWGLIVFEPLAWTSVEEQGYGNGVWLCCDFHAWCAARGNTHGAISYFGP